ncbi:unnamed protein product [Caenorhabditis angaria]|uniref:Histone-lysine N-methyltransferase NSD-like variant PHD zinc finger domain-containing protein n=1 Tax=Caenorhabditis angaria TaxID=860376 RepID=A0A9P1J3F9_9PELO|nr:unnamed protein product [Caenorhabditis angaria]
MESLDNVVCKVCNASSPSESMRKCTVCLKSWHVSCGQQRVFTTASGYMLCDPCALKGDKERRERKRAELARKKANAAKKANGQVQKKTCTGLEKKPSTRKSKNQ